MANYQNSFPELLSSFPEPQASNVPTPQEYRQAIAVIKAYRKKVRTNHAAEKTQRIAEVAKIKDASIIQTIERILSDEV